MAKFRINRRTVIKGAGSIAIALPWLEIMDRGRRAQAQAAVPLKRFVSIYQPGGTVIGKWRPTGTETAFTLSPILKPLEALKSKLVVLDGLYMKCGDQFVYNLEQHQGGSVGWLSGQIQPGVGSFPRMGPSIDQVLGAKLSTGKPYPSLEFAVRWATGKSQGKLNAINAMYFGVNSPYSPIAPRLDPQDIFNTLFGTLTPGTGAGGNGGTGTGANDAANAAAMRKKSILDYVDKRYQALSAKLGAADRIRFDAHLTELRKLEQQIVILPPGGGTGGAGGGGGGGGGGGCQAPTKVVTTGYNPTSGLNSSDTGSIKDLTTDNMIPTVGKFMMDMMTMALACEKTAVTSLQWTDTEAKHTFPWLSLSEHHHFYQHDGGFRAAECEKIATWYSEMHAYLLQKLQAVDMGGHTLLDETVVLMGSELGDPPTHAKKNMPLLLASGNAALKGGTTGRYLKFTGDPPHNKLLTSILNLYGDTRTSFGDSRVESSPLSI